MSRLRIYGSWLKDVFKSDQYLHFIRSLLSIIRHYFLLFNGIIFRRFKLVILLAHLSITVFFYLEQRSPESKESHHHPTTNIIIFVVVIVIIIIISVLFTEMGSAYTTVKLLLSIMQMHCYKYKSWSHAIMGLNKKSFKLIHVEH